MSGGDAAERSRRAVEELVEQAGELPPGAFVSVAWFPAGEYEQAIDRWPAFAEQWAGVEHGDYSREIERHLKRVSRTGVPARAVAPLVLEEFLPWCEARNVAPDDPDSSSHYAAELANRGAAIRWPPERNAVCWCGSGAKYKKCCGTAEPS